jgi:hypothetical protein
VAQAAGGGPREWLAPTVVERICYSRGDGGHQLQCVCIAAVRCTSRRWLLQVFGGTIAGCCRKQLRGCEGGRRQPAQHLRSTKSTSWPPTVWHKDVHSSQLGPTSGRLQPRCRASAATVDTVCASWLMLCIAAQFQTTQPHGIMSRAAPHHRSSGVGSASLQRACFRTTPTTVQCLGVYVATQGPTAC